MIEGKNILITGGSGFIGSATARLLGEYNSVKVIDMVENPEFPTYTISIINQSQDILIDAVIEADIIIHMAARLGVKEVIGDVIGTLETNIIGTSNILSLARLYHKERVIVFSTSEIFGSVAYNVGEDHDAYYDNVLDKRWSYAVSKLAAEQLALAYYRQRGLPVVVIRPFNVFGAGRSNDHAVTNFVKAALTNKDMVVNGQGTQIRSWCYIDDFCNGVLKCVENDDALGQTFNIGNPLNTVTVYQLASIIRDLCGSDSNIVFNNINYADIEIRIPDISKAINILGYIPEVSLIKGLNKTIEWMGDFNAV